MQTILPKKEMTLNEITQKNTLEEIGQLLREKREEQDYTLEQVAEITKITASTLHNIESGNLDDLPGFVFVKGFIRNYANLLKINSDAMIKELNAAYEASNEDACPDIEIEDKNLKSENNAYLSISLIIVVIVIVLGIVIYFFYSKTKKQSSTKSMQTIESTKKIENITLTETNQNSIELDTTKTSKNINELDNTQITTNTSLAKTELPTTEITQETIYSLTLLLKGKKDGWIRLTIDDEPPFETKIEKGKSYKWPAKYSYDIIMTTRDIASIYLNGEEVPIVNQQSNQIYQDHFDKFSFDRFNQ